ncbi:uncharacterized protein LOC126824928 [Patella vulgata]|uniref:uncharacterized protein LOC126824928 n=1 Tax=Patella vulgata TaxID=6465 RepID=UPI0024A9787A|nr:uncharacterized protein LOC126824928 [Patella vulgata]
MECKSARIKMWSLVWISFLIFLIKVQARPTQLPNTNEPKCSTCQPGYFVHKNCSRESDTICKPCPHGMFNHQYNLRTECNPCSKCGPGLFELKQCTQNSDVFCESCASKLHKNLKIYLEFCLGYDEDVAGMQADEGFTNKDGGASDETDVNNVKDKDAKNKNDEKVEITDEGSGEVIENFFDLEITLPPAEVAEDELLPFHSNQNEDSNELLKDSVELKPDDILEGSGGEINVLLTPTTYPFLEDLASSGEGEVIDTDYPEVNDTVDTVIIGSDKYRTHPPGGKRRGGDGDSEVVVLFPLEEEDDDDDDDDGDDEMTKEEEIHAAGVDNRQRAIIIIGVVVGAVAFFTLSFVASRYYRRKRSFKIIQDDGDNKDLEVNGSKEAIEFDDMSTANTRSYDEPDTNGRYIKTLDLEPNGTNKTADDSKKSARPRSGSTELDKHVNGIDRMKYMDETDAEVSEDEAASAKLLPKQDGAQDGAQDAAAGGQTTSLTDVVLDKLDQRLSPIEEERAPMLPKSGKGANGK